MCWDYPGYGRSGGPCSEGRLYDGIERVYSCLTKRFKVPPEKVSPNPGPSEPTLSMMLPDCRGRHVSRNGGHPPLGRNVPEASQRHHPARQFHVRPSRSLSQTGKNSGTRQVRQHRQDRQCPRPDLNCARPKGWAVQHRSRRESSQNVSRGGQDSTALHPRRAARGLRGLLDLLASTAQVSAH